MCDIHNKFKQQNAEEAVKPLEISQLQSKVVSNVSELKGMLCLTNMLSRKARGHHRDRYLGRHKACLDAESPAWLSP